MVWLAIFVALMIPLAAVILDSPVVRSWADRRQGLKEVPGDVKDLVSKVNVLENELEAMSRQIGQLQESQQFLQRLLEDPAKHTPKLPKSTD
jgi:outer membrane murein-binding lipoprotein Lpp